MQKLDPVTEEEWLQCNEFNRNLYDLFLKNSTELSPKTIDSYRSNLKIWFNYVRTHCENKREIDIIPREFMFFQNWLIGLDHSSADVSNKRSAVSSLNNWIVVYFSDMYPTFHNFVTKGIKKPENAFVHEKKPLTKAEFMDLIIKLEEKEEWEQIAYLKFTLETGCRRAESRQILKNIVNAKLITKTIKVKNEKGIEEDKEVKYYLTPKIRCKGKGKTGKTRVMKFSDYTMDAFKKWLEVRGEDNCPYMFVVKYKQEIRQVGESTFNSWCNKNFTKLVGRRVHPHLLRESRATQIVVEEGKNIEAAQKLLGHVSSTTTQIYVIRDDENGEDDELFVD